MSKLGQKYRELRKEQGLTLYSAAEGICSVSNLSRWENGKIELDFRIVVKLLNKVHINTEEFLKYTKFIMKDHIPDKVMQVYTSEDTHQMKVLVEKYIRTYYKTESIYDLYLALILANQYKIIKKKSLLTQKEAECIYNYLSNTTLWSEFNLSFFGNSVFLIKPNKIYAIGMIIIRSFDFEEDDGDITGLITALGTLGDATVAMILQGDIIHAQKMLQSLIKLDFPKYLDFFSLVFTFLDKIISYTKDKDAQKILAFIDQVVQLNMKKSAKIFLGIFKKIINENQ